jgi:hypothetical protein
LGDTLAWKGRKYLGKEGTLIVGQTRDALASHDTGEWDKRRVGADQIVAD